MRWSMVVLGWSSIWLLACGDDGVASADSEETGDPSTGDGPTSTSVEPSTGTAEPTGSGSTTTGEETSSESTTGSMPSTARASLIVRSDLETPGVDELFRIDVVDGVVTEPVKVSGAPGDGVQNTYLSDSQTKLFYRTYDSVAMSSDYGYVPLEDGEASPAVPVHHPPAPDPGVHGQPMLFADETRLAYFAAEGLDGANAALWVADVDSDGVGTPANAVGTPPAGEHVNGAFSISASGEWISYRVFSSADGIGNAWIAPLSPVSPAAAIQVSDLDQPERSPSSEATFVAGDQALWYRADRDIDQVYELFFVDLTGPVPGTPVRIHDPLLPDQYTSSPRQSPDGTRLAYFVAADVGGDVYVVSFDGATVSTPIEVSTLGDLDAYANEIAWSPDGDWLVYSAEHEQADAVDLYVVDMSGPAPSDPMLVTAPGVLAGGGITAIQFDPAGTWLYVIAAIDSLAGELYRTELAGGEPGELQRVSGDLVDGTLPGTILLSHDSGRVLYHIWQGARLVTELYVVDVSGAEPGAAVKVNAPLAVGEETTFFAGWSGDDSAILYATQTRRESPRRLFVVDADALGDPTLVEHAESAIILDHVPR